MKEMHQKGKRKQNIKDRYKLSTQEGSNQNTRFLNGKSHTPPETKGIKQAPNSTKDAISP
jgi:hypothetical protein